MAKEKGYNVEQRTNKAVDIDGGGGPSRTASEGESEDAASRLAAVNDDFAGFDNAVVDDGGAAGRLAAVNDGFAGFDDAAVQDDAGGTSDSASGDIRPTDF